MHWHKRATKEEMSIAQRPLRFASKEHSTALRTCLLVVVYQRLAEARCAPVLAQGWRCRICFRAEKVH